MKDRLVPVLAAAAVVACMLPAVLQFVGRAAALELLVVGARRRDGRAVLVGGAFWVMAALHEQANAFLRDGAGTQFEPLCVDALERLLARERNADLAVAV